MTDENAVVVREQVRHTKDCVVILLERERAHTLLRDLFAVLFPVLDALLVNPAQPLPAFRAALPLPVNPSVLLRVAMPRVRLPLLAGHALDQARTASPPGTQ